MSVFRLLHLADFHIANRPRVVGINEWSYLKGLPLGLQWLAERFGFVAPDWRKQPKYPFGEHGFRHPSSYDVELANATARFVWEQTAQGVDAVLVTGDLATTGSMADLDCAGDKIVHVDWLSWRWRWHTFIATTGVSRTTFSR